ncbi:MAG: uracil-DNA glycosylase [Ectothiorhodospiraceae bacterium]|nr:uracil-DNA glycosylase [Ectothiorhodospiraceae bacterium]
MDKALNKEHYLTLMGIDVWREKRTPPAMPADIAIKSEIQNEGVTWQALQQQVTHCTACGLDKTRTQTVFGVGNQQADLLIIGEAPGANEDKQGEPFVGRAGQLLNNMLKAIGLARGDIYIANILKCRPPNNRDPQLKEVSSCTPFLTQQIALLKPNVILALGRIASHFLLQTDKPMKQLRNKTFLPVATRLED